MSRQIFTDCFTLQVGCVLYQNAEGTIATPQGFYSNGVNCFEVNVSGVITSIGVCPPPPTTTTTSTTTSSTTTTTAAPTTSTTTTTGTSTTTTTSGTTTTTTVTRCANVQQCGTSSTYLVTYTGSALTAGAAYKLFAAGDLIFNGTNCFEILIPDLIPVSGTAVTPGIAFSTCLTCTGTTTTSTTSTTTSSTTTTTAAPTTTTTTVAPGTPLTIEYLVVGGGGPSGADNAGGGGAGGFVTGSTTLIASATNYLVTIGAGGVFSNTGSRVGGDSSFGLPSASIALGGGGGAANGFEAKVGGSGGGGNRFTGSAVGTPLQGNAGGDYYTPPGSTLGDQGGGGGGAASTGSKGANVNLNTSTGGAGGAGKQWLDGNYYAGGGGGQSWRIAPPFNFPGGLGGIGGGGNGGSSYNEPTASAGTPNTGGGGGAANTPTMGGSGIVRIRYAGTQKANGGLIIQSGSYTYHTFNSSSNFNY
jgi:hypothetical protein